MKRPGQLKSRSAPLRSREPARDGGIKRKTRIKKVNPERQAKRRIRQGAKHRAYMRSETRKIVDDRANCRCEATVLWDGALRISIVPGLPWLPDSEAVYRCQNKARSHHHVTYARYGGNELPEDMLKVCRRCHDWLEAEHPTRQPHLRQTGRARSEESE